MADAPKNQDNPRHSSRGGVVRVLVAFAIAALVFFGVLNAFPTANRSPVWRPTNAEPTRVDFRFAMFPSRTDVQVFDAPDGQPIGVLNRAMANTHREVVRGGWIRVLSANGAAWVPLNDLRYAPPADAKIDYFTEFKAFYLQRDTTKHRDASLTTRKDAAGQTIATFTLKDDDYSEEYDYAIDTVPPRMIEMRTKLGAGEQLNQTGRYILAVVASLISLLAFAAFSSMQKARHAAAIETGRSRR